MIFISLACCNISPLLDKVLDKLFENTESDFVLSFCDNNSNDRTVDLFTKRLSGSVGNLQKVYRHVFTSRRSSVDCINQSLIPAYGKDYSLIVKLDHDYGLPPKWDFTLIECFSKNSDLQLLSPGVVSETPKGFQYYSQGHKPELITQVNNNTLYHYQGIAGYCHSFRQDTLDRLKFYKPLTVGAVFGSEDADWSIRCGSLKQKAYVFNLEGWHWDKPEIGSWEDKWKCECTFGKTYLQWEDWAKINLPEELKEKYLMKEMLDK